MEENGGLQRIRRNWTFHATNKYGNSGVHNSANKSREKKSL
jgi:hypothetical protein